MRSKLSKWIMYVSIYLIILCVIRINYKNSIIDAKLLITVLILVILNLVRYLKREGRDYEK